MSVEEIEVTASEYDKIVAEYISKSIQHWIKLHDRCVIGLSGGSTPKPIYALLSKDNEIAWDKVALFLVDDRYINASHNDSNQNLIKSTILNHVPVSPAKVVLPNTDYSIKECIAQYKKDIDSLLEQNGGAPDIVVLGMGDDGHIASLFPPLSLEQVNSIENVVHTTTTKFAVFDRISVSLNVIKSSKQKILLLKGQAKLNVWDAMNRDLRDQSAEPIAIRWPMAAVIQSGNVAVAKVGDPSSSSKI